jgi:hypothetical protein
MKPIVLPLLAAGALVGLGACEQSHTVKASQAAAPAAAPAPEAPKLWSIEVMQDDKAVSRIDICADEAVRASFARPAPEFNGKTCERVNQATETAAIYSVKCRMDERLYRVGATKTGDEARDFTVDMSVKRQDAKGPIFEQARHYRLIGACPAGWVVGDSQAPGAKTVVNTLTGASRPLPAPAG